MKRFLFLVSICAGFLSCGGDNDDLENQTISFTNIPVQQLSNGTVTLTATATSGLPVTFTSSDASIATISGSIATLKKVGTVSITAVQSGDSRFYEAPKVSKTLTIIPGADPSKQDQTITFVLTPTIWKSSLGELELKATSSSGLPVSYTVSNDAIAKVEGGNLILLDGTYENVPLTITASQIGNAEFNPAPNVAKTITVEHDTHD
jgi:uncharacterized protein YjdB